MQPHPWNSPGKNTGVGCHFLLQCIKVKSESEVAQSCPTLFATPWTAAYQAPPSMGFSRQEYWSGVPLPSPEVCNRPGLKLQIKFKVLSCTKLLSVCTNWANSIYPLNLVRKTAPTIPWRQNLQTLEYNWLIIIELKFGPTAYNMAVPTHKRETQTLETQQKHHEHTLLW